MNIRNLGIAPPPQTLHLLKNAGIVLDRNKFWENPAWLVSNILPKFTHSFFLQNACFYQSKAVHAMIVANNNVMLNNDLGDPNRLYRKYSNPSSIASECESSWFPTSPIPFPQSSYPTLDGFSGIRSLTCCTTCCVAKPANCSTKPVFLRHRSAKPALCSHSCCSHSCCI